MTQDRANASLPAGGGNGIGQIFAAFAEQPFKYARAR